MRDGQFSNTRVVCPHVVPPEPTSASFVSATTEHVARSLPTSAESSILVCSSSACSSSDQFSRCPTVVSDAQLAVLDAAGSVHHQPSGTSRLKRGGVSTGGVAHAPIKQACRGSSPKRAKRGLKRTASDPVDAIDRLRAARRKPFSVSYTHLTLPTNREV